MSWRTSRALMNVRVSFIGGEAHETDSTELAFRQAAADAFHKALAESGEVLLEPIMKLEITTPEENLGEILAYLESKGYIPRA